MTTETPKKTPLLDLLRSVPADGRHVYEHDSMHSHNIPYGRLCREAADELDRLSAEVAQERKVDTDSRRMFVARLENMQKNGDNWMTVAAVLALLNDCDMLALSSKEIDRDN